MKYVRFLYIIIIAAVISFFALHKKLQQTCPPKNLPTPERIVSLAPNLTEILFALGLDEKIVAVSDDSDYPPQTAEKKKTGSFWQPGTEAIIAAKPDLVVTLSINQQTAIAKSLEKLGYRTLSLKIEKIDELFPAIKQIGWATGHQLQADTLIENIIAQLNDLKSRLASTDNPKVLWVVQPEPLRVAGTDTFINEFIEFAGGKNAIGPAVQKYPPIGAEEMLASGAQVIIHSAMATTNLERQQQDAQLYWSKWPGLPAVKNNRIYVVQPDTVLRLGPRLCSGIELIARYLHPAVFSDKINTAPSQVNQ